jgi:hypothetical protein
MILSPRALEHLPARLQLLEPQDGRLDLDEPVGAVAGDLDEDLRVRQLAGVPLDRRGVHRRRDRADGASERTAGARQRGEHARVAQHPEEGLRL